ncbi:MAG: methyltransferase domain-containing protein, partial [Chloroflexota bacterium]
MRGFLRPSLATIAIVAVAGAGLLWAMGLWRRVEEQYKGPTGFVGGIVAWTMPLIFRSLYDKVATVLDLRPEDEVLDVACGSGVFLRKHASHVRGIAGLDHSEIQISLAIRENSDRVAAGTAEFVVGDVAALPWADDRFSAVTSNCLDCFAEPRRSLEEMHRVLRPGGRAVLINDVRPMMEASGFTRVSVDHVGSLPLTT